MKRLGAGEKQLPKLYNWVISQNYLVLKYRTEPEAQPDLEESTFDDQQYPARALNAEGYNLTEEKIIHAGTFLFDLQYVNEWCVKGAATYRPPPKKLLLELSSLVALLLSLARVEPEDRKSCSDLLMSFSALQRTTTDEPCVQSIASGDLRSVRLGITKAFDILYRFVQGPKGLIVSSVRSETVRRLSSMLLLWGIREKVDTGFKVGLVSVIRTCTTQYAMGNNTSK